MKTAKRILYILLTLPLPFLCLADCDSPVDPDPPYDGPWEKVEVPEGIGYYALDFLSPTNGWSCGYGSVGHWDGNKWEIVETFTHDDYYYILDEIEVISDNNMWVAGTKHWGNSQQMGAFIHYDGNGWTIQDVPELEAAIALYMFDDGTGWGGAYGIYYYDNINWSKINNYDPVSMYFNSKTDGWACGLSSIYHWDGTEWTESLSDGNVSFRDIYFSTPDDGWAITHASLYGFATHYHWDGTEWTKIEGTPFDQKSLDAIHFVDSDWGWIIGSGRTYFYDGVTWKEYLYADDASSYHVEDIYCLDRNNVWISSWPAFLHFSGFNN